MRKLGYARYYNYIIKQTMLRKYTQYLLPAVLFAVFAAYILLGDYSDMLFTAQDRNEFFYTGQFFHDKMTAPFGLMSYLGSYLTQFFFHPAFGATLLILLWVAIYGVTIKAFRLDVEGTGMAVKVFALIPASCLLASVVEVGYWVYILPFPGYWFSMSLAYLCVILLLWASNVTPARFRALWYLIGTLLAFPLLGFASLFFALCLLAMQCARAIRISSESKVSPCQNTPLWHHVPGILVAVLTPFIWQRFHYTDMHIVQVFKSGFPYFESSTVSSIRPSYPFMLLAAVTLVLPFVPLLSSVLKSKVQRVSFFKFCFRFHLVSVAVAVLVVCSALSFAYRDYNYLAEMRMTQAAMNDDWQTIIQEAEQAERPSRTMVVLTDIALLNTNALGTRAFEIANSGEEINNPDSLNLNIMQIAAPVVYYNFGKIQFATRWCMENAMSYGFSPFFLRMFARAALEQEEPALVRRYMHLLSKTKYYADWKPTPASPLVRALNKAFLDVIDSDNNDCERYIIQNFSVAQGSNVAAVKELNLFYAMIYRDPALFWPAFYAYAAPTSGANLPVHYQEAYMIMQDNYHVDLPFEVRLSPVLEQRYRAYGSALHSAQAQGMSEEDTGESLRQEWGSTYWWYLMYGRKTY